MDALCILSCIRERGHSKGGGGLFLWWILAAKQPAQTLRQLRNRTTLLNPYAAGLYVAFQQIPSLVIMPHD